MFTRRGMVPKATGKLSCSGRFRMSILLNGYFTPVSFSSSSMLFLTQEPIEVLSSTVLFASERIEKTEIFLASTLLEVLTSLKGPAAMLSAL